MVEIFVRKNNRMTVIITGQEIVQTNARWFGWFYPNINSPWSGITSVTIFSASIVQRQMCDKLTSAHLRILST